MKTYEPESSFQATDDASMVYNLRHKDWRKSEQVWTNDVAISITAHHLSAEERADIANTIRDTMNAKYLPNVYACNSQRELEINHKAIHECRDDLLEALRKAVAWGDAASTHILYRENINWRYLDEARATLATYSSHNAYRRALTSGECLKCLLNE